MTSIGRCPLDDWISVCLEIILLYSLQLQNSTRVDRLFVTGAACLIILNINDEQGYAKHGSS